MDFWPTVQNKFFKISTDSDFPSKAGPSCAFISKSVKKDKVRGVFVFKIKKIDFWPTVQKEFFKISTDSDSPSNSEPSCIFSSKFVEKWRS